MSSYISRHWTCDRCGKRDETDQTKQPLGWSSVQVWSPPLMAPADADPVDRKNLCRDCTRDVRDVILTAPGLVVTA